MMPGQTVSSGTAPMGEAASSWAGLVRELAGAPVVWRDLAWRDREPVAVVEPLEHGVPCGTVLRARLEPGDAPLVRALPVPEGLEPRWCAGFAHAEVDEQGAARFRTVACPKHQRVRSGQQCGLCRHLDRFRPLHRVHRGAQLTDAALAYVSRPHWLYTSRPSRMPPPRWARPMSAPRSPAWISRRRPGPPGSRWPRTGSWCAGWRTPWGASWG